MFSSLLTAHVWPFNRGWQVRSQTPSRRANLPDPIRKSRWRCQRVVSRRLLKPRTRKGPRPFTSCTPDAERVLELLGPAYSVLPSSPTLSVNRDVLE